MCVVRVFRKGIIDFLMRLFLLAHPVARLPYLYILLLLQCCYFVRYATSTKDKNFLSDKCLDFLR